MSQTGMTDITITVPDEALKGIRKYCAQWWKDAPEAMGIEEASKWYQVSRKKGWGTLALPLGALLENVLSAHGWMPEEVEDGDAGVHTDAGADSP